MNYTMKENIRITDKLNQSIESELNKMKNINSVYVYSLRSLLRILKMKKIISEEEWKQSVINEKSTELMEDYNIPSMKKIMGIFQIIEKEDLENGKKDNWGSK